ncbi:MAG TPA: FG-GAP-like repeat-containing protein [Kofleriaceae bacterium]|nr:FG-GAP-like repeat-containing protein [Kofleriaceae bacterium]
MRRLIVAALCIAAAACGDNELGIGEPLAPGRDLVLIAHQDDDLLFMQPDVIEAVRRGTGVTNVYVTAGNDNKGPGAADPRYQGLKEAYGAAAGDMNWDCGWIEIAGHVAQHCRLAAENMSLLFLAYPDGGEEGQFAGSLLQLWNGTIKSSTTVADRTAVYDQPGLIATIAEIIGDVQPRVIRTLDVTSNHGHDHVDHMIVGALALLAVATTAQHPDIVDYRGYDSVGEPINKIGPIFDEIHAILGRYEACTSKCGACGTSCTTFDKSHNDWLGRRYAFGFRRDGSGLLAQAGACLYENGQLGDCTGAPVWSLDRAGELTAGGSCLAALRDGTVGVLDCDGAPEQHWFFDDEGHVWSAVPPVPQANMEFAHLNCLTATGVSLCGMGNAPTWQLLPLLATTSRASIAITASGRAVRLGDLTGDGLADLCSVDVGGTLACAPGDGAGHFGAAVTVATLAIDPDSLAIGDIDGDGMPDACGRSDAGTICALAATGFASEQLTTTFGASDSRPDTAASLQVAATSVCGADATGVTCATAKLSFQSALLSTWPAADAIVWPGDLDGDGSADWCSTGSAGLACGVAAETGVTTDGVPWMYSNGGTAESVPGDPALTAVADIDGDGNADLCAVIGNDVQCARSQGRGFGPLVTIMTAPSAPVAVWLGDLDGDGRADTCVDLGDTIACEIR